MKVGDYVRIELNGIDIQLISKIKKIRDEDLVFTTNGYWDKELIIKSSPDIIDLLEVGDVLSFKDGSICRIIEISDNGYYLLKDFGGEQYYERKEYIDTLISIVTKEQFESMQYNLESQV